MMNRRSFFAKILGTAVAAKLAPPVIEYAMNTTGLEAIAPAFGTIGAINRATFSFWRNDQHLRQEMRRVYDACSASQATSNG